MKSLALALDVKSLALALVFNRRTVKSALFSSYERRRNNPASATQAEVSLPTLVTNYLDCVRRLSTNPPADPWSSVKDDQSFTRLHVLFEKVFCSPATSAPVERVFSHSGLFMRPHRARMGDKMLSNLVFLKCNKHII